MRSCQLTRRYSRRHRSGHELSKQKATRNTGSGELLAYASFLQLLARRSNSVICVANKRSTTTEAPGRVGRHALNQSRAHGRHEEYLRFGLGELRIFQGPEL